MIINGHRSRSFLTGRGVRQGCPLSPLLFALCIEPLADAIRNNLFIRGVRIPNCTRSAKISLFADDTTTFIADIHDWKIIKEILLVFSRASGLKLNYNKLLGVWLSPSGIPPPELKDEFPWLAKGQKERILGYRLGIGLDPNDQLQHVVDRIRERMHAYCPFIYSPSGRVLLLKMCIHSLLWYFAYVTPPSKSLLSTLNRWCYNFIWRKYKQPLTFDRALSGKVSRAVVALPRALGGLNYQKLEVQLSSLRLKWIRHLFDANNDALWKQVVLSRIHSVVSPWLPRTPQLLLCSFDIVKTQPLYLSPILHDFHALHPSRLAPPSLQEVLLSPLFFNPELPLLLGKNRQRQYPMNSFRHWARIGVRTIQDLFTNQGAPLPFSHFLPRLPIRRDPTHYARQHTLLLDAIPPSWWSTLLVTNNSATTFNLANSFGVRLYGTTSPCPIHLLTPAAMRVHYNHLHLDKHPHSINHTKWDKWFPSSARAWDLIWHTIRSPTLSIKHHNFLWNLAHHSLPVGKHSRIKSLVWHANRTSPTCPLCANLESIPHALFDCRILRAYWLRIRHFASHFLLFLPTPSSFRRQILLGDFVLHSVPQGSIYYDAWIILRACSLHTVWVQRCTYLFHPPDQPPLPPPSAIALYHKFLTQLSTYANSQFLAARYHSATAIHRFSQLWLPGILTQYKAPAVIVKPPAKHHPYAVCRCPSLPDDPDFGSLDFIPLTTVRKRCHCGAPPHFGFHPLSAIPPSTKELNEFHSWKRRRTHTVT